MSTHRDTETASANAAPECPEKTAGGASLQDETLEAVSGGGRASKYVLATSSSRQDAPADHELRKIQTQWT